MEHHDFNTFSPSSAVRLIRRIKRSTPAPAVGSTVCGQMNAQLCFGVCVLRQDSLLRTAQHLQPILRCEVDKTNKAKHASSRSWEHCLRANERSIVLRRVRAPTRQPAADRRRERTFPETSSRLSRLRSRREYPDARSTLTPVVQMNFTSSGWEFYKTAS